MDTDTGIFIQQGDSWYPESAARHNMVNDMLTSFATIGPVTPAASGGTQDCIVCKNISDEIIPAYSYVTVFPPANTSTDIFQDTCTIRRGTADPCGVTLNDCGPGETASVQISGLIHADVFPAPPDVMILPGTRNSAGKHLVNLNSIGCSIYRNYFKVSAVEWGKNGYITKVRIYDGGDPEKSMCGETDVGAVEATELEYTFSEGTEIYIHLNVEKHEDGTPYFTHTFKVNSFVSSREPVLLLAEISRDNHVIQRWTGGKIYWRDRFVIPFGRRGSGYA
jgi:hypothetical protein